MKAIMYSKNFNGESVSVDPANVTIGLSKYPTRNITGVHIKLCAAPSSWLFKLKKILKISYLVLFFGLTIYHANNENTLYKDDKEQSCGKVGVYCGFSGERHESERCQSHIRMCNYFNKKGFFTHYLDWKDMVQLVIFPLILVLFIFLGFCLLIVMRKKKSLLIFGNATDKPVLVVQALTFKEYLKLVLAGDPEAFDAKLKETSTPLIEFRDEIGKSINELSKT